MKRTWTMSLVLALFALVLVAPLAWAAEIEGKVKAVDAAGITLEDGTQLTVPPTVTFDKMAVKPGATVKASYEEKDGQKVATRIQVAK
jgi:uncharacterized protein DUF1344